MKELNNSYIGLRIDLLKHIKGESNVVLDVGCALGINGQFLIENKIAEAVYGIEYDKEMAFEAEKCNTKVFCGDLNDKIFRNDILKESPLFDYVICGDILEHLYEPAKVLEDLRARLHKDGKIIISLPNIAHIELFIQVYLKGSWPQNNRGIFDKTHLRWFTKKDCFKMVESCNLSVVQYERNLRPRDAIGSKFDWKYKLLKLINKDLVTFQHIIVCEHA